MAQIVERRESPLASLLPLLLKSKMEEAQARRQMSAIPETLKTVLASLGGTGGQAYVKGLNPMTGAIDIGIRSPEELEEQGLKLQKARSDVWAQSQEGRQQLAQEKITQQGKEREEVKKTEANVARSIYRKDLENFLAVDDVLQGERGEGDERFKTGFSMMVQGFRRNTPLGKAVAQHGAARKRLRVQLVRAAGDVGNLNIVEQEAAELLIPTEWEDSGAALLKRAYLKDLGKAIDNNSESEVRRVINSWKNEDIYKLQSGEKKPTAKSNGFGVLKKQRNKKTGEYRLVPR